MSLPVLRPGQTHPAVLKLKKSVVAKLQSGSHSALATAIRLDSKTYGPTTVRATKQVQHDLKLTADGVVGEHTWRKLGFTDPVVDETPPALHGIPYEPGVVAVDGHWVVKPLADAILAQRRAGRWHGVVNSGYRPPWYQQRLWAAAVKKYGSETEAANWVARPGHSHHGMTGIHGAVDVTNGDELATTSPQFIRPVMPREHWHFELQGSREMPGDAETRDMPESTELPEAELEQAGVTVEDVDEAIGVLLERIDKREADEAQMAVADDGYDPEAAGATREPEAVTP